MVELGRKGILRNQGRCNDLNTFSKYKNWRNSILKHFYFEKSVKMAIGDLLLNTFREILLGQIVLNRTEKK
jgi:hypothetical protein